MRISLPHFLFLRVHRIKAALPFVSNFTDFHAQLTCVECRGQPRTGPTLFILIMNDNSSSLTGPSHFLPFNDARPTTDSSTLPQVILFLWCVSARFYVERSAIVVYLFTFHDVALMTLHQGVNNTN